MRITVNAPASAAPDYLRQVADQLEGGLTSGYWHPSINWETARDAYDPKES